MRRGTGKETADEEIEQSLNRVARYLSQPTFHYLAGYEQGTPGVFDDVRLFGATVCGFGVE